mmetsp:Transcript_136046/g.290855  ORF Transcript_136046/g.290855 Transcript_136046/m.290855 type:complete len:164 (-) Transcript_136046:98-589(-)
MAAWRERPRRFVEPPLVTSQECLAFKQSIKVEVDHAHETAKGALEKLGGPSALDASNGYLKYFKKQDDVPPVKEHNWTIDKVQDNTNYDQYMPRDTYHPSHTEAARKKCKVPFGSGWQVRSSQAYGWLPSIDEPNYGYGRSSIFLDSSMDKSHLGAAGPWSAR